MHARTRIATPSPQSRGQLSHSQLGIPLLLQQNIPGKWERYCPHRHLSATENHYYKPVHDNVWYIYVRMIPLYQDSLPQLRNIYSIALVALLTILPTLISHDNEISMRRCAWKLLIKNFMDIPLLHLQTVINNNIMCRMIHSHPLYSYGPIVFYHSNYSQSIWWQVHA